MRTDHPLCSPRARRAALALIALTLAGGCGDGCRRRKAKPPSPPPATAAVKPGADADALAGLRRASTIPVRLAAARGAVGTVMMNVPIAADPEQPVDGALGFLADHAALYGLEDPRRQLYLERWTRGAGDRERHVFFHQRQGDLPVFGATLGVHLAGGAVVMTHGDYYPDLPERFAAPAIDEAEALRRAAGGIGVTGAAPLGGARLGILPVDKDGRPRLAWQALIGGQGPLGSYTTWTTYVDAADGSLLVAYDDTDYHDKDFDIMNARGGTSESCWIFAGTDDWFDEDGPLSAYNAGADAFGDGQRIFDLSHTLYDYFHHNFGFDSYDDDDAEMESLAHVGYSPANATASGSCGDIGFSDQYVKLDVFAHELTHLIDDNAHDLASYWLSGALKESFADIMAAMVDADDWTVGEELPGGAVRSLSQPSTAGSNRGPDHMLSTMSGDKKGLLTPGGLPLMGMEGILPCSPGAGGNDNCGVHTNAGIPNKAAFLAIAGGTHGGFTVKGMGRAKGQQLWFSVLVDGVTEKTTFDGVRDLLVGRAQSWAASGAHGFTAADVCSVRNGFAAVGVRTTGGDRDCDGAEDETDRDDDGDGTGDATDNCPALANPRQADMDKDNKGDDCDDDRDGDGVPNGTDKCPWEADDQADPDNDGRGEACDDDDWDNVVNRDDRCPGVEDRVNLDTDKDGKGDACDDDDDGDGFPDVSDPCPDKADPPTGPVDADGDQRVDSCDNCPGVPNGDQKDCDHDGIGRACERLETPSCELLEQMERIREKAMTVEIQPGFPGPRIGIPPGGGDPGVFGPDDRLEITVAARGPSRAVVVDGLGKVIATSRPGPRMERTQTAVVRFRPSGGFHYVSPGTTDAPFSATSYHVRVIGGADVQLPGTIQVERTRAQR